MSSIRDIPPLARSKTPGLAPYASSTALSAPFANHPPELALVAQPQAGPMITVIQMPYNSQSILMISGMLINPAQAPGQTAVIGDGQQQGDNLGGHETDADGDARRGQKYRDDGQNAYQMQQ